MPETDPRLAAYLRAYAAWDRTGPRPPCARYRVPWQAAALARWVADARAVRRG